MRKYYLQLIGCLSVFFIGGCTVHPLQQNVTGIKTSALVDSIWCETRLAVQDKAIDLMMNEKDLRSRELATRLEAHRELFTAAATVAMLTALQRRFYYRYIDTSVAFHFSFDVGETNLADAVVDPLRAVTFGTLALTASASGELTRNNKREFVVAYSFDELLSNNQRFDADCTKPQDPRNFMYPITGAIGMKELIATFIDLNEDQDLRKSKDGPDVFVDTLGFTTKLSLSGGAHVELTPLGSRFGFDKTTGASATAKRTDIHQVIVGLAMGDGKPRAAKFRSAAARPALRTILSLPLGSAAPATPRAVRASESRAVEAVRQQRILNSLDRLAR